jgi:hypothetical protein
MDVPEFKVCREASGESRSPVKSGGADGETEGLNWAGTGVARGPHYTQEPGPDTQKNQARAAASKREAHVRDLAAA